MSAAARRLRLLRHLAGVQRAALGLRLARPRPGGAKWPVRVAFLPPVPGSVAGMAARVHGWKPHLERRGFEVSVLEPCTAEEFALLGAPDPGGDEVFQRAALARLRANLPRALAAHVVVLHRGLIPFSPWQRPTLDLLLMRKHPAVVLDFFDSLWASRERARSALRSSFARWLAPADGFDRVLAAAAAVTVSGGYLADYARRHAREVHVVPMVVEPDRCPAKVHGPARPVTAGWMGNAGNLPRLASVVPALRAAAARHPLRLKVVSSAPFAAEGLEVEPAVHPWTPESEVADLLSFDIGLLPLRDDPVDRGKSPFKLLQYAAAGLPVVASPVAVDPEAFVHGESILFAASEGEWASAVASLAGDPGLRARMGAAARAVVAARFSFEARADGYAAILRSAAERGAPSAGGP